MCTNKPDGVIRTAAAAMLLAAMLAGCTKPAPAPEAAPAETAPAPDVAPAESVQPSPDAPPPTEPSAAAAPSAASEPSLESMSAAKPSAKMSVAVNLRYSFDGAVSPNQPVTLHLAAVPRAAGTNLKVSVRTADGLQLAEGPLNLQKAGGSDVYRKQVSVTQLAGAPSELRVLVTMNMGEDLGFGFYSIPLDGGTTPQKQDSVKQR